MKILSVADRDRGVTSVQGSGISSSISSELRIVPGPHAAVDASVAGYRTPKVLSMTVYYCPVPLSAVIVFRSPPLPPLPPALCFCWPNNPSCESASELLLRGLKIPAP